MHWDEFAELKDYLSRYAGSRASLPRETVEREIGELLLMLLNVSDGLGIDLIMAGEQVIGERAGRLSRFFASRRMPPSEEE
jgi:NTP pyrophosphatase (non-canonical NTP hydrolase)